MVFKPVPRAQSLVDTVVEQVQRLIAEGHLQSGDRLPRESELVEQLGVSRTVLREALSRLEATGLVRIQRGQGMFVNGPEGVTSCARFMRNAMSLSGRDLSQFVEFRQMIESYAARRAADRATPEDFAELTTLCEEMNRKGQDYIESIRLDYRFHVKIVEMGGNELMRNAMEVIQEFIMAAMVKTTPRPRDYENSRALHMKIVEALRSGDADRAEKEVRAHTGLLGVGLEASSEA